MKPLGITLIRDPLIRRFYLICSYTEYFDGRRYHCPHVKHDDVLLNSSANDSSIVRPIDILHCIAVWILLQTLQSLTMVQ